MTAANFGQNENAIANSAVATALGDYVPRSEAANYMGAILRITFDEDFAKATGIRADAYNLMIAIVIAVIIVVAMNLVGSLLISALVIFPSLSAMRLFKSFRSVTVCSAVLSVVCALFGILVSIIAGTPVGATIVCVDIVVFFVFLLLGRCRGGAKA